MWADLVPEQTPAAPQSSSTVARAGEENYEIAADHQKTGGGELNESASLDKARIFSGADARRSTRINQTVPLVILGANKLGQSFLEVTSAVSLNLHGCRCTSQHAYPLESWITLWVTGTEGRANSPVVRAKVQSIHSPQTPRELCQVGVEFETPGNVWGIDTAPEDWLRLSPGISSSMQGAFARKPATIPAPPVPAESAQQEVPMEGANELSAGKSETVVFMSDQVLSPLVGKSQLVADRAVQTAMAAHLDEAVRTVLARFDEAWNDNVRRTEDLFAARLGEVQTRSNEQWGLYRSRAEEIARRLEQVVASTGNNAAKMQKFAERVTHELELQMQVRLKESLSNATRELENAAAQASQTQFARLTEDTQVVVQSAIAQFDARVAEARPILERALNAATQQHLETLLHSSKEQELAEQVARELQPQVYAKLDEFVASANRDLESAAARVADRQLARLMEEKQRIAREAAVEIEAAATQAREVLQRASNTTLEDFRRQAEEQIDLATSKAMQTISSSIASLDAENHAVCEKRRWTLETDVARAAEQSTQEFRKGIKAFLYSCFVAVNAAAEHAQARLDGPSRNEGKLLQEIAAPSEAAEKREQTENSVPAAPQTGDCAAVKPVAPMTPAESARLVSEAAPSAAPVQPVAPASQVFHALPASEAQASTFAPPPDVPAARFETLTLCSVSDARPESPVAPPPPALGASNPGTAALRPHTAHPQDQPSSPLFADVAPVPQLVKAPAAKWSARVTLEDATTQIQEIATPEPVAEPMKPAGIPKLASLPAKSSLGEEELQVPSWLEPLTRKPTAPASTQELIESESAKHLPESAKVDKADDLFWESLSSVP
jgi:hypothetical protein